MENEQPCTAVRLDTGPELAAALPQLLGFVPEESLVLVALTGSRATRVGVTLRVDLPGPDDASALATDVVARLGPEPPAAVVALVVTEASDVPAEVDLDALSDVPLHALDPVGLRLLRTAGADLPGRGVVRAVGGVLADAGVPLLAALLVRGGRCWDYDCADPCCDPGAGRPLPGGTSALAVASVVDGRVVAADRAELVARLAPATGVAALAMGRACSVVGAGQAEALHRLGWEAVAAESWRLVQGAVAAGRHLTDEAVARLGWALTETEVRDQALALGAGPTAAAAEALWTELVRRLPAPLDAAPATLLAATAWARGDGTTAGVALDRALASQPGYRLAQLLRQGLTAGLPPSAVRELAGWARPRSEQLGA
ncbi:protein of unknown function [Klenkia soli]|uniref:DUF4192 domain-containing protein n=1 Tax=Klenkia soli TaxID=1052260 RepID=A0A1H0TRM2_9ACTN|nr:DUF4192 domain-containing protein [Klenkia soli]SDP56677.1 protein of unknown function [Klenkia soli]